jgi:hypothetical protein
MIWTLTLVCDEIDNCPEIYNPLQADADFDGIGDECETVSRRRNLSIQKAVPF